MSIIVKECGTEDLPSLLHFLVKYEASCVQLCAYVKKMILKGKVSFLYLIYFDNRLWGVFTASIVVLHSLPFINTLNLSEKKALLKEISNVFSKKKDPIRAINGVDLGSVFIAEALKLGQNKRACKVIDYRLYVLDKEAFIKLYSKITENSNIIEVNKCKKVIGEGIFRSYELELKEGTMLESLYKLSMLYEKEEVFSPEPFSKKDSRLRCNNALQTQFIYAFKEEGGLVSKVQTNAIGFNFLQLGGVFTIKKRRGEGLATILLISLLNKVLKLKETEKKKEKEEEKDSTLLPFNTSVLGKSYNASLFVRVENKVALALYKRLCFCDRGGYKIIYY